MKHWITAIVIVLSCITTTYAQEIKVRSVNGIKVYTGACNTRVETESKGFHEAGLGIVHIIDDSKGCPITTLAGIAPVKHIIYIRAFRSDDKDEPVDVGFVIPELNVPIPLDMREVQITDKIIQIKFMFGDDDVFIKELRKNNLLFKIGGSNERFRVKAYTETLLKLEKTLKANK